MKTLGREGGRERRWRNDGRSVRSSEERREDIFHQKVFLFSSRPARSPLVRGKKEMDRVIPTGNGEIYLSSVCVCDMGGKRGSKVVYR